MSSIRSSSDDYGDYGSYEPCEYEPHGSRFLLALYSFIFLLGLLGNTRVIWVILQKPRLRNTTDLCILNLAVADLLHVCSLPFLAHQAQDQWIFGEPTCRIVLGAHYLGFYGGMFFVTLMSMDRYLAIVHPFKRTWSTRTKMAVAATVTWVAAILFSFSELLNLMVHEHQGKSFCLFVDYSDTYNNIFALLKRVLGLLIPMAIMGFCYTMIVRTLLIKPDKEKQTFIRLVVVVVLVFFCCWAPYNVTTLILAVKLYKKQLECEASRAIILALQVTEPLAYFHSCINPIIYMIISPRFRIDLCRVIRALSQDRSLGEKTNVEELSINKSG